MKQIINPGYSNFHRNTAKEKVVKELQVPNEGCTRPGGTRHDFMRQVASSERTKQANK